MRTRGGGYKLGNRELVFQSYLVFNGQARLETKQALRLYLKLFGIKKASSTRHCARKFYPIPGTVALEYLAHPLGFFLF